ncbi:MAG: hypothetical protein ACREL9_04815 [Gemmatimonadales bacterium]
MTLAVRTERWRALIADAAWRRGRREVTLWLLEENAAARGFYERLGFHADGGRKHYPGTEVPEVRYRATLRGARVGVG